MEALYIWAIVAVLLVIVEIFTSGFAVLCFAIGAGFAAIGAALGCDLVWQIVIFSAGSILGLIFLRPFILKYLHTNENNVATNADALIGKEAIVVETIEANGGKGRVKIDGDVWQAVAEDEDNDEIAEGTRIVVLKRDSIVLVVKVK